VAQRHALDEAAVGGQGVSGHVEHSADRLNELQIEGPRSPRCAGRVPAPPPRRAHAVRNATWRTPRCRA
jgi:hypothetical protein